MRALLGLGLSLALIACGPGVSNASTAAPVTVKARDGITVFARHYKTDKPKALILLFHQAGSGKGEYATIAPRLNAAGYDALAIDQRSGGEMFGENETALLVGKDPGYLAAQPDLQAAVDWAKTQKLPVIIWGSSYSSSLVFPLAAANPGVVKAVLSFSPGEYFDDKSLISKAAAKLAVPVFVTSAGDAEEVARAKPIFDAVPGAGKVFYQPKEGGVHGSSTLIEKRNPKGAEANWTAVLAFLKSVTG
ncbi:alpha/beta hydrolase [Sphingomonas sp. So64.6b]|uniref:alpha/beta hydrolase n=1 Tax=Sphingomonas sp. So64.6b TaxID=2997354 RepID=UPI0015FF487E|nr:alpha/beta hydrolase [Sphingomonas sp. So64.6b]QNA84654.1 alpha/beta hydrolase [Sphingomonas sp. So64.6b]